jgi:Mediator of RNA polymerase II transcription subunit 1
MATPSAGRPHSGSTPKNPAIATPTPMMPSPRPPTSAAMGRNISHKSPAMKTPASGHGHSRHLSTSSHPASTPLTAGALGEEILNLNSPAAIMMSSLGSHGLTPLPSGPDGLGISNNLSTGHGSTMGTRNPEEDKVRRLQEVVKLLRTRVAGRGIYREGVERLAQLAGFTHMWQGNTLAIAGMCVDLEITFDEIEKDNVKDVVLKIFTPESEQHKKDASEVLKADLEQHSGMDRQEPWRSLESFATNLEQLGRMDHLSQGINCFEAIDGLYLTFQKVWDGEKKRMRQRRELDCLNKATLGRPVLNRKQKLGLSLDYWAERRLFLEDTVEGDAMDLDSKRPRPDASTSSENLWSAKIDCEVGYPSLRVSKEWIAEKVFENAKSEESTAPQIVWIEPPPTLVRPPDHANESNGIDGDEAVIKIPKPPEVRFVLSFEPSVLLPMTVTSVLNGQGISGMLDNSRYTTYEQALGKVVSDKLGPDTSDKATPPHRWNKSVKTFDKGGETSHHHSYILYSTPQVWCYPVQSITFDHPKRLANIFPLLRQYALLFILLRSIVPITMSMDSDLGHREGDRATGAEAASKEQPLRKGSWKRSNLDARQAKLNVLLQDKNTGKDSENHAWSVAVLGQHKDSPLPIDVCLGMTSSTPLRPRLDLIWPLPADTLAPGSANGARFGNVSVEVGTNGEVSVPSAAGFPFAECESGRRAMSRVIELGEDLGLLVEWIMERSSR